MTTVAKRLRQARMRAAGAWTRVEAARPRYRSLDVALFAYDRHRLAAGNLLAGALAFRAFLWLVPFTLVTVAGLGFAAAAHAASPGEIAQFGISGYAAQQVATVAAESQRGRWFTLVIGLLALVQASLGAAKGLRVVHAIAWRLPPLGLRRGSLAGLAFLAGATLLLAASAGANWLRARSPGPGLWVVGLVVLVYFAIWLGASRLLPHAAAAPWTAMIPGAVLFAVGVEAIHLFTVLWLSREITHASRTYGSIGVAVSLLGGLYLFGELVVASAMLNASRWERRLRGRQAGPSS
jgi:uncharacterized BrkB/YihY/UPF0761 family membrane protein